MTRLSVFTLLVLATFVTACSKEQPTPAPDMTAQTASEARNQDERAIAERLAAQQSAVDEKSQQERLAAERRQYVASVEALASRWRDALTKAQTTDRADIGTAIAALEAIKNESDAMAVSSCTGDVRSRLQTSMSLSLQAFAQFRQETGPVSEAVKSGQAEARAAYEAALKGLPACLSAS